MTDTDYKVIDTLIEDSCNWVSTNCMLIPLVSSKNTCKLVPVHNIIHNILALAFQ